MNKIIPYLKNVKPLSGYKLWLEFNDGIKGEIDLSKWIGKGVFSFGMMRKTLNHSKLLPIKK